MTTNADATATSAADPREVYRRARAQTAGIIASVRPEQLGLPTPCAEYDVRALMNHIVGGTIRCALMGEGADALAVPARVDGVPDTGWNDAYRRASERVEAAWADDTRLDAMVAVPWGKVPGRGALAGYIQEVLTHGWDLAVAIGHPTELDQELGEFALDFARRYVPAEARDDDELPFDRVIPAPEGAGAYAQLAAWLGRQPS